MQLPNPMIRLVGTSTGTLYELDSVLSAADCGLMLIGSGDVVQVANERALSLFGAGKADVLGKSLESVFTEYLLPRLEKPQVLLDWIELVRAMRGFSARTRGADNQCELILRNNDRGSHPTYLQIYASSAASEGEEPSGELIVIEDITSLRRAERALNLVSDAARAIDANLHPRDLLVELQKVVRNQVPADAMAVLSVRDDGKGVVLGSAPTGFLGEEGQTGPLSGHLPGDEILVDIIPDVQKAVNAANSRDRRSSVLPSFFLENISAGGFRSIVTLPLKVFGRVAGIWVIASKKASDYSLDDMPFLIPVSEHLSAAINSSNLLDTTRGMYSAAVKALAATADYRDTLAMDHSERVSALAGRLAEEMGFRQEEIEIIRLAGFVHDVGKIGIPDAILQKPGPLDPHEMQVVKSHAELGASILDRAGIHPDVGSMVLHHHEWHDGSGYPGKLSGNSIPAGAAILAVADAFDTMVSDRSYKARISVNEALDEVNRCAGGQFDPQVSKALEKVVRKAVDTNEPWLRDLMGGGSGLQALDFGRAATETSENAINSKELEVLFRIAQEMKKLLDLDELLKHMANLITDKMGYTDCLILIPDDSGENLVIAAAVGMSGGIVGMRVPQGTGVSWWVMTNGKAQNVADVSVDPRYYEAVDGVGSEVYVPLEVRGKRLGVLVVQKAEKHGFGTNDVRLMLAVAGHIASALEVAQLHERVKRSADSDALTGLYNRRVFLSNLENSIRRASQGDYGGVVTVGILDVNLMKEVNDFHGHLTGDAVLSKIGSALAAGFRVCDVVARYAGDEFVVLLPGASAEAASKRIEEVINQWSEGTVETPAHEIIKMPGACFGTATYPGDGVDARVLLSVADDRLLGAKKASGKGRLPSKRA